jgi:hypothetical protein
MPKFDLKNTKQPLICKMSCGNDFGMQTVCNLMEKQMQHHHHMHHRTYHNFAYLNLNSILRTQDYENIFNKQKDQLFKR